MTVTAPEVPAPVRMQQLLSGFEVSQALYVVAELGVATALLDGPRTVKELALATGADADALGRIIRFLASLGVFQTNGETVPVTDLGRTLADGPPGLRPRPGQVLDADPLCPVRRAAAHCAHRRDRGR